MTEWVLNAFLAFLLCFSYLHLILWIPKKRNEKQSKKRSENATCKQSLIPFGRRSLIVYHINGIFLSSITLSVDLPSVLNWPSAFYRRASQKLVSSRILNNHGLHCHFKLMSICVYPFKKNRWKENIRTSLKWFRINWTLSKLSTTAVVFANSWFGMVNIASLLPFPVICKTIAHNDCVRP